MNPNCDGSGPHTPEHDPVRVLPLDRLANGGNLILCRWCYHREMNYRRDRNRELAKDAAFDLPAWESLRVYEGA